MQSGRSKLRILGSFGVVMALMLLVAAVGLTRMAENNLRMETIVDQYNVKTGYLVTMYNAARERSIRLLRMVTMEDPFARDQEYLRFNDLAAVFAEARIALSQMKQDREELNFYVKQRELTEQSVPLQEQVVQFLVEDRVDRATDFLLQRAIPAQDRILAQLVAMMDYQQLAARRAMDESRRSYQRTVVYIGVLLVMAIAVGLAVAVVVMRRTRRAEQVLLNQVTQERKLQQQLSYQASHDVLTGLINRFEFEVQLQWVLESAHRERTTHALMYLDLDQFKVVNDTCGHVAGDELLRQLSGVLQQHLRSHDILARLGGDEFGIILKDCDPEYSASVANKLLNTVQEFRFVWEDKTFAVGASIGVVMIDADSESLTDILSAADAACYSAKDAGRNRVHVVRENDATIANRYGEMQWVTRITEALEEGRFRLYAQQISALGATDPGASGLLEIMLRMQDGNGKLVPPGAFIPAAERYNLMASLDRWVITETLKWLKTNASCAERFGKCSVNISGQSVSDARFLDYLMELLSDPAIPAHKICFEITETSAIINLNEASEFITRLRGAGCSFALDDFGSGISSFAYLKNLPVDYLKIDGAFVRDIVDDPIDAAMVRSINEIGHVMGKKTIAEFVENEDILDMLRKIGVDYAQGYAIGAPKQLDDFVTQASLRRRASA
jgi:diguanylate cyclase (GGDEF)-like protein